jgi:hypothetical protein
MPLLHRRMRRLLFQNEAKETLQLLESHSSITYLWTWGQVTPIIHIYRYFGGIQYDLLCSIGSS